MGRISQYQFVIQVMSQALFCSCSENLWFQRYRWYCHWTYRLYYPPIPAWLTRDRVDNSLVVMITFHHWLHDCDMYKNYDSKYPHIRGGKKCPMKSRNCSLIDLLSYISSGFRNMKKRDDFISPPYHPSTSHTYSRINHVYYRRFIHSRALKALMSFSLVLKVFMWILRYFY